MSKPEVQMKWRQCQIYQIIVEDKFHILTLLHLDFIWHLNFDI